MFSGVGSFSSSHWDLMGTAMVTPEHVRLTPDLQSRMGAVWSRLVSFAVQKLTIPLPIWSYTNLWQKKNQVEPDHQLCVIAFVTDISVTKCCNFCIATSPQTACLLTHLWICSVSLQTGHFADILQTNANSKMMLKNDVMWCVLVCIAKIVN